MHHTVNKHHFPHQAFFRKYAQEKLQENAQRNREWLIMGPSSHEKLTKTVMEKQLLNNLSQISKQTHATLFEVFHGSKIPYLPKSVFYEKEKTFT